MNARQNRQQQAALIRRVEKAFQDARAAFGTDRFDAMMGQAKQLLSMAIAAGCSADSLSQVLAA